MLINWYTAAQHNGSLSVSAMIKEIVMTIPAFSGRKITYLFTNTWKIAKKKKKKLSKFISLLFPKSHYQSYHLYHDL